MTPYHSAARAAISTLIGARLGARFGHALYVNADKYGGGYIPDRLIIRATQRDSRDLFMSTTSGDVSLAAHRWADSLDQGRSSGCTWHGSASAIWVSHAAVGKQLAFFPSPRIGYAVTRILELPSASAPLQDIGAMPSDIVPVAAKWGIAPIGFGGSFPTPDGRRSDIWTSDDVLGSVPANVNDKPKLLDLETAGMTLQLSPLRVDETSTDFGSQIRACLQNNIAGGVGIFVDTTNFMQWDPATGPISTINLYDVKGGGHWLELDYIYTLDGETIVGGDNSWGSSWATPSKKPSSPFWRPGSWEMTLPCLQRVCSDCLFYPAAT